ncbi:NADP-dependent oxidoreductase [Desulfatitalea alkaliphila]|uniref:NADP-dependent oxidoreductase n=1 Tax=Desulfatitalea alkaliphila TaxID=2929485 RepID=A0AA41R8Q0_9BACT|nr:NADP-dependent oxidoreductase [Desulfatitalea alkaliphila]MCJ8503110.1 NADP-dependent oxidoreductase [Desulfatitalea alkaliphila]
MKEDNIQVLLARRPEGDVTKENFEVVSSPLPELQPGQFLVRNHYLSLDPYMRGRMSDGPSYAQPVAVGDVMVGGTVGEVAASKHADFQPGERVLGFFGWQRFAVSDGTGVTRITEQDLPLSVYLGAVGMPGVTAYIGLMDFGRPKAGETVVVAAASGAVGSVVGQVAKIHGCRAVGIAGGPDKCRYVTGELGLDACVDYKAGRLREDLAAATPDGIDIYFENVGGPILDTVLARMNPFGRIPLCGLISQYNATEPYRVRNFGSLLINRLTVRGFIVSDHLDRWPAALKDLAQWVRDGKIKYRESIVQGIENAPAAFIGLLAGKNFGKQLIDLR